MDEVVAGVQMGVVVMEVGCQVVAWVRFVASRSTYFGSVPAYRVS